jgi:hypothetical protein
MLMWCKIYSQDIWLKFVFSYGTFSSIS